MSHPFLQQGHSTRRLRKQAGLSLIELLVAITIGAVLVFGATQAYVDSRNAYSVNETVARLQETAAFAISVIEPDVRMSNYWGLLKGAESIEGKFRLSDAASASHGAAATTCGTNYALDLDLNIQGTESTYSAGCEALNDNPMPLADTITVRRASVLPSTGTPAAGPLRICSTRGAGALVTDTAAAACTAASVPGPTGFVTGQINDLIVNLYYVAADSDHRLGVPSLRRWFLDATPDFQDAEIISGIEDMQIQYGVDRTGGFGPAGGAATQYLDAGTALDNLLNDATNPAQIVSVRFWLLVRADEPEVGFVDNRVYEYGSRSAANGTTSDLKNPAHATWAYQPSLSADDSFTSTKRHRRLLVSRTIQIRNALGT